MAPSRLLQALLSVHRFACVAPKSPLSRIIFLPLQEEPCHRAGAPWQRLLRNFSAGRGGGDDGDPFDPFGKARTGSSFGGGIENGESESQFGNGGGGDDDDDDVGRSYSQPQRNGGEEGGEELRLFGKGGLFEQTTGRQGYHDDPVEEWEDQAQDQLDDPRDWEANEEGYDRKDSGGESAYIETSARHYEGREGVYGEEGWSSVAGAGHTKSMGVKGESAAGEYGGQYVEESGAGVGHSESIMGGDFGAYEAPPQEWEGDDQQGWVEHSDVGGQAPAFAGEWEADGRFRKAATTQGSFEGSGEESPTAVGDADSSASFGDLIKKSGFTDDDIANLMAGFYEPVGLPHLDDYKFIDMDSERKKMRREMELAKMAEMAKRWVRKVDEHGFAHAVGRRKKSRARVWIKEGEGRIVINRKHHDMYFTFIHNRVEYLEPFIITATLGMFDTFVLVKGGGVSGQASAIRHGVSRALMWYDPSLRPTLKSAGMLRRDDREVERKKYGKAKARKSYQWVKR